MTRRRKKQQKSVYRLPEYNDHMTAFSTLGNYGVEDDSDMSSYELSDSALSDKFISHWMKNERPFKKYEGFRRLTNLMDTDEVLGNIKVQHQSRVVKGDWSEEKFLYCLDRILEAKVSISNISFERYAFAYENGREQVSDKNSGKTSTLYSTEEKKEKIDNVLSAWERLEALEDDD